MFFFSQNSRTRRKSKIFENSTVLIDSIFHHFFQLTKFVRQSLMLKLVMKSCRFLNRKKKFVWMNKREQWIFNYRIFDNRRDCFVNWTHKQIHRNIYLKFERFRCWAYFKFIIWCNKEIARSCERLYDRRHHRMLVNWAILIAMFK